MIGLRIMLAGVALLLAAGLGACGGSTVKVEQSTQISKGWELKDLKKAHLRTHGRAPPGAGTSTSLP